ncbi:MAG: methyltransferase family protein [Janthinobacterium lividum]
MQATALEYRHRYLVHGLIYTLGFLAPWTVLLPPPYRASMWSFVQNNSSWFLIANALSKPLYLYFATYWNAVLVVMILFGAVGAGLRTWGAAYLGASTVQRGGMVSDRMVADGPYRYVRNPLYLGTLIHSVALAFLMRPDAAVVVMVLLTIVQLRLIGREEPYLQERQGDVYRDYLARVPRLLPSLRPRTAAGTNRADWKQGILSEIYGLGTVLTMLTVGWSRGFGWENSVLRVMQGIVISLGVSVVARAFIPKATY